MITQFFEMLEIIGLVLERLMDIARLYPIGTIFCVGAVCIIAIAAAVGS